MMKLQSIVLVTILSLILCLDWTNSFQLPIVQTNVVGTRRISSSSSSSSNHKKIYIFPSSVCLMMMSSEESSTQQQHSLEGDRHVENVLFIECGFGNDSHGQNSTKAAVRACRNAIEFNSIPSVNRLVPNGYDGLKLDVLLAIPPKYRSTLDLQKVKDVFPYGSIKFQLQDGGMIAPSGIAIDQLGDKNDDMVVVCASVTVGY